MERSFWQERWRRNEIAFHEGKANTLLTRCFDRLRLKPSDRVFVPLCGKAVDLDWIAEQGFRVRGIELDRGAVEEIFSRGGLDPRVRELGALTAFTGAELEIYVGDIFDLSASALGPVEAVYDRAALVALPEDMRKAYAEHVASIAAGAQQLVIAFDYDQDQMRGPPFSVGEAEIRGLYGARYTIERIAEIPISGRLAERCEGDEVAWLMTPR